MPAAAITAMTVSDQAKPVLALRGLVIALPMSAALWSILIAAVETIF
jgi:hypothetical protein